MDRNGVEVMLIAKIHFWNVCTKGTGIPQKLWGKMGNGDNVEFLGILELNVKLIKIALEDQRVMLSTVMDQVPEVLILYLDRDWKSKFSKRRGFVGMLFKDCVTITKS